MSSSSSSSSNDPIIGLDVCGKIYYCHVSTLIHSGSPYFSNRFGGNFDADAHYVDERNRTVYFLERCPHTFDHVFRYLITGRANLPSYDENPALRRALRDEADYFGLAELSNLLQITRTFSPEEGNRGVLYWLGTSKGKLPYDNPYTIGAVHVGGWVDDPLNAHKAMFHLARSASCRANFCTYQQPIKLMNRGGVGNPRLSIESYNYLLWCDHGMERLPVTVDLKSIALRPSHYSLRVSQCYGMQGDWNLEGSQDGDTWDTLHAARGDDRLCLSESSDIITKLDRCYPATAGHPDRSEALLKLIEQDYRHTWELRPPPVQFYRYFRIIGAGSENDIRDNCLHGEGIELFGDVWEE